jgi:hypothetical protein
MIYNFVIIFTCKNYLFFIQQSSLFSFYCNLEIEEFYESSIDIIRDVLYIDICATFGPFLHKQNNNLLILPSNNILPHEMSASAVPSISILESIL